MNPTLGAILLVTLSLPLILYVQLTPRFHELFAQFLLPQVKNGSEFDFVVVGAGSAGSVVAGRLAENGHSVLLIEAGGPANYFMAIPAIVALFQKTPYDWQYLTTPQKNGGFGMLQGKFYSFI